MAITNGAAALQPCSTHRDPLRSAVGAGADKAQFAFSLQDADHATPPANVSAVKLVKRQKEIQGGGTLFT